MKCQTQFVRYVTGRLDNRNRLLYPSFCEAVIHDIAVGLSLAPKAERLQKGVIEWPHRVYICNSEIDMIDDHGSRRWTIDAARPTEVDREN